MRYMNPGYKEWLSTIGDSTAINNVVTDTESKTGVAIYNRSKKNVIQFDFPASGEIFCKCDFYASDIDDVKIYIGETAPNVYELYNGVSFSIGSMSVRVLKYIKGNWDRIVDSASRTQLGIANDEIKTAFLHLKWADSEVGFMEVMLNDYDFGKIESAELKPYNNSNVQVTIYNGTERSRISNIIISDAAIPINEQIVPLPIVNVDTDMVYDSETGIYTASVGNQYLLATVNTTDLISNVGANSKVTGIAVVGNPAYRSDEGLTSFTALTKRNDTVTEYGAVNIPVDSSVVVNSFEVASDITVSTLQDMQIGLKVGV